MPLLKVFCAAVHNNTLFTSSFLFHFMKHTYLTPTLRHVALHLEGSITTASSQQSGALPIQKAPKEASGALTQEKEWDGAFNTDIWE